jgi:hypothetical protein
VGTQGHAARKNHCFVERKSGRIRPHEGPGKSSLTISAKPGWGLGCGSAIDSNRRTIWDTHRDDGKRFVVHADEKLTAFLELESAICAGGELV